MPNKGLNRFELVVIIILILVAVLAVIPTIMTHSNETNLRTISQEEAERTVITANYYSTVLEFNTSGPDNAVDVEIENEETRNNVTLLDIAQGETRTVTLDGNEIKVTHDSGITDTLVAMSYEYPTYMGWPAGLQIIVENSAGILLILILFVLLTLMHLALQGGDSNVY